MSSNKRQSIVPRVQSGPKAPVNFSQSIIIADSALLTGNHTINISSESVVHPRAKLDSSNGRITIGRRCIVHERTSLGALSADPRPSETRDGVFIGDYVTIEVSSVLESGGTQIGDGCLIAVGCKIGKGAKLGKYCTLTPQSVVQPFETIPDFTVIYSNGTRRIDKRGVSELKNKVQARQIETLRRLIPSNPNKFLSPQ
ncbi:trimeric LpxA-like protein [Annulohypoxylon moriforme]|nr:trimeric LpxA-like protein [Annulohypoxylon moriforme]